MLSRSENTATIAIRADRILQCKFKASQVISKDDWNHVWHEATRSLAGDDIIKFDVLAALRKCGWAFID